MWNNQPDREGISHEKQALEEEPVSNNHRTQHPSVLLQSTHQLKPCLLVGVCFSSRAVSCSRDSFWSRFICNTDWQLIWSWAEAELGRWEFWKLGQRSFCGLGRRENAPIEM